MGIGVLDFDWFCLLDCCWGTIPKEVAVTETLVLDSVDFELAVVLTHIMRLVDDSLIADEDDRNDAWLIFNTDCIDVDFELEYILSSSPRKYSFSRFKFSISSTRNEFTFLYSAASSVWLLLFDFVVWFEVKDNDGDEDVDDSRRRVLLIKFCIWDFFLRDSARLIATDRIFRSIASSWAFNTCTDSKQLVDDFNSFKYSMFKIVNL